MRGGRRGRRRCFGIVCGGWVIEKRVRRELLEEVDSRQLKVEEKELTRSSPRRVEQAACPCSTESLPLAMLHGIDVSGRRSFDSVCLLRTSLAGGRKQNRG